MEVDYLKKAIQLSAVDFIEKPINFGELRKAVGKAVEEARNTNRIQTAMANREDIQKQNLIHMIRYKNVPEEKVCRLCREIGFPVNGKYTCLIWILTELFPESPDAPRLMKKMERYLGRWDVVSVTHTVEENRFVTIASVDSWKNIDLLQIMEQSPQIAAGEYKMGIGIEVSSLKGLSESYQAALVALGRAFYRPEKSLFTLDDQALVHPKFNTWAYSELCGALRAREDTVLVKLDAFFAELTKFEYMDKEHVLVLIASLVHDMVREEPSLAVSCREICRQMELEKYLNSLRTLEEVKEFVIDVVILYMKGVSLSAQYSAVIYDCMKYISVHCVEADLSLQKIAEYAGLSPNYFSLVFKSETGHTVRQCIENSRIEIARRLLENHNMKIVDVAEKCGFSSAGYFSKVFRNVTGMTPAAYRKGR